MGQQIQASQFLSIGATKPLPVAVDGGRPVAVPELVPATEAQARRHREAGLRKSARLELSKQFAVAST